MGTCEFFVQVSKLSLESFVEIHQEEVKIVRFVQLTCELLIAGEAFWFVHSCMYCIRICIQSDLLFSLRALVFPFAVTPVFIVLFCFALNYKHYVSDHL